MKEMVRYLGIDTLTQLLAEQLWCFLEGPSREIIASFYRDTRESAVSLLFDERAISRLRERQRER